jgi:hypothetical protein
MTVTGPNDTEKWKVELKVDRKEQEYVPGSKRRNMTCLCPKGIGRHLEVDNDSFMRELETFNF